MITRAPLLAKVGNLENLVSRFRGEYRHTGVEGYVVDFLLLSIVAVLAFTIAYLIWRQLLEKRANSPQGLFSQLCAAHALEAADRRLLKRLARQHELSDPSLLFLNPQYFEVAPLDESPECDPSRMTLLHERLFA